MRLLPGPAGSGEGTAGPRGREAGADARLGRGFVCGACLFRAPSG